MPVELTWRGPFELCDGLVHAWIQEVMVDDHLAAFYIDACTSRSRDDSPGVHGRISMSS